MINFFFKKEKIVLDCFTYLPYVYDFAKIDSAIKFIPDWWKKTPKFVENQPKPTIKSCPGFVDLYKKGIVIPSWFELEMKIYEQGNKNNYSWFSSNQEFTDRDSHEAYQFEGFCKSNGQNFKITSPWAFKTKENISFVWNQPVWNQRDSLLNFSLLPATINYKYQHGTNINYLIVNGESEKTFKIPALTPLVMMHGLTEKTIEVKNHLVTEKEWERLFGIKKLMLDRSPEEFLKLYRKKINLIDKIDEMNK